MFGRTDGQRMIQVGAGVGVSPISPDAAEPHGFRKALEEPAERTTRGVVVYNAALMADKGAIAPDTALAPDIIAGTYWALHTQPAAEWNAETYFDGQ
jgi:hypothetical protein